MFSICVRDSTKSHEHARPSYMKVKRPIDKLDAKLRWVCVRWISDDEVENSLRQDTGSLEQEGVSVKKWFCMKRLKTLQD